METKDLVLLMLIPILLVSLVVYTDRNPTITAAVTAQQEQSNVMGTYSIAPSFKAKVDYDLNDYTIIKQSLDFISKCSEAGGEVESCTNQIEGMDNRFEWSLGCDRGAEKVLYDLAEFYQDCFDSDDNNCLCRKDLPISKDEIEKYGLSNREYIISLAQDIPSKKIEVKTVKPKSDLTYDIKLNAFISIWHPNTYVITYTKDKAEVNMIFKDELSGSEDNVYGLGPLSELTVYKNDNNKNKIKSLDFVREENDNLIYPNPDIIIKKPDNLHDCNLKPKNIVKFCVTKKDSKVMAYDKIDGLVKERHVTTKFASYISNPPPTPLKNVEVYDKPKAEKSVLVKWEKSTDKDVAKYRIYYTEKPDVIDKTSTKDLRKNGANKIELNAEIFEAIDFDDISECEFDYQEKKCYSSTAGGGKAPIENKKLYYSGAEGGVYVYGFDVEDNKGYDFAVTAVDKNSNEIDNVNQKFKIIKSMSIDDLAPDSGGIDASPNYDVSAKEFTFNIRKMPAKNIDNSELKDFKNLKIYYKKYQNTDEYNIGKSQINGLLLKDLKIASILEQTASYAKVSLPDGTQTNNMLQFVIIAVDKSENPIDSEYGVMDIGAKPFGIEIQENGATLLPQSE